MFLPHHTDWKKIDDGIVFDVPDCELGHHREDVSFNSIIKKYGLTDEALVLLGEIVRAADSHPAGRGSRLNAGGFGALGLISKFSNSNLSFTMRSTQNASAGSEVV